MSETKGSVETIGIEHVPEDKRHGTAGQLFSLWLASNLTIADYALGFLPVSLGLSLPTTILALLVGNLMGGALLSMSVSMGPRMGYPQMVISRWSFGRRGNYVFAGLNWVSTVGWFTVNVILGSFAMDILIPGVPIVFWAALLVAVEVALAIFGYDAIHRFERIMAVVLGLLFILATALVILQHGSELSAVSPLGPGDTLPAFGITLAAAFSYVMSWSPYGSDYARYLPKETRVGKLFTNAFLGAFIASFWLEVLGALVAFAATGASNSISALPVAFGYFAVPVLTAIVLGAVAANVLNIYTNALSALVLDIRAKRWLLVVVGGGVGLLLAQLGSSNFGGFYSQFLLFLDYWITPWLGIMIVDFFVRRRIQPETEPSIGSVSLRAFGSYLAGLAASLPFIPSIGFLGYRGFLAPFLGGADFSYFISFGVAAALTYLHRGRGS